MEIEIRGCQECPYSTSTIQMGFKDDGYICSWNAKFTKETSTPDHCPLRKENITLTLPKNT